MKQYTASRKKKRKERRLARKEELKWIEEFHEFIESGNQEEKRRAVEALKKWREERENHKE